jgi:hypothetical protein
MEPELAVAEELIDDLLNQGALPLHAGDGFFLERFQRSRRLRAGWRLCVRRGRIQSGYGEQHGDRCGEDK